MDSKILIYNVNNDFGDEQVKNLVQSALSFVGDARYETIAENIEINFEKPTREVSFCHVFYYCFCLYDVKHTTHNLYVRAVLDRLP